MSCFFSSRRRHTRLQGDWSSDVCSSDLEALLIAAEHPGTIDLVLADVIMPRTSGPGLMTKLRELRPTARVIFMSGFTEIGRASCRERVEGRGVAEEVKQRCSSEEEDVMR